MYEVTVEASFNALHRVRCREGPLEPVHGHDWVVRAKFARASLDELAMVVDFCEAQEALNQVIGALQHANLNEHPMLNGGNPTAEAVARAIFDTLFQCGPPGLAAVTVTEAPGCVATYRKGASQEVQSDPDN